MSPLNVCVKDCLQCRFMGDFVSRGAHKALHASKNVVMSKPILIAKRAYLRDPAFTLVQLGAYCLANVFQESHALPYLCELGSCNSLVSLIHDTLNGTGCLRFYLVPNPPELPDIFHS